MGGEGGGGKVGSDLIGGDAEGGGTGGAGKADMGLDGDGAGESVRETACRRRAASRSAQLTSWVMATDDGVGGVDAGSEGDGESVGESVRETACRRRAASRSAQVTSRTTAIDGGADGMDGADGIEEAACSARDEGEGTVRASIELQPGLGVAMGPGVERAAGASADDSNGSRFGGGGSGDAMLVPDEGSRDGEAAAVRLFAQLEPGLGRAAGPGTKRDAGAAVDGLRCGGGGGGDAASLRAVGPHGMRAATELVSASRVPGLGIDAGPGKVASLIVRKAAGGGSATAAEVELILNCRVRRPEDVVEKK